MSIKIKLKQLSGVPTTDDLETSEVGIDTVGQQMYVNVEGVISPVGQQIDLSDVNEDILPAQDAVWNLGSPTKRWAELYLTGNTINLGGALIDSDGTGTVSISGAGMTIPDNSRTATGNELAVIGTSDGGTSQVSKGVDFFVKDDLDNVNTRFLFNASINDRYVFTGTKTFTLTDGTNISSTDITLFQF